MTAMLVRNVSFCSSQSLILFTFGSTLAVVLMTFQYEHKLLLLNSPRLMLTIPSLSLISVCGLAAALVGLLYPMLISSIDRTSISVYNDDPMQKCHICKSVIIFVGINQLCAKITFPSDIHFTIIVILLCIAFWWWCDGTKLDFTFSIIIAFIFTIIIEILLRAGALQYTNSDNYLKTCVPCLTFAGAILTIQITKLLSPNKQSLTSNICIEQEHVKND